MSKWYTRIQCLLRWFATGEAYGAVKVPTLLMGGECDPIQLLRQPPTVDAAIPGSRLKIIPKMWHLFFN